MLLAIDTSTRYAGVALADGPRVVAAHCWFSLVNHTVELMPAVAATLRERGLKIADLEGIAVALGPGGFSALRVGLSVAKGLAFAGGRPLVGVGTLELEAYPYRQAGLPVCALLDAGRREVMAGFFLPGGVRQREDWVGPPEELLPTIAAPTIFCGEGVSHWGDILQQQFGQRAVVVQQTPASRLWALAALAQERLAAGETANLATLQPYYLRMPSIGGPKRRDWTPQQS